MGRGGGDKLFGGGGQDKIDGGAGNDVLKGGAGADKFVFRKGGDFDRVTDFQDDTDSLDFRSWNFASVQDAMLLANTNVAGNTIFNFGNGDRFVIENTAKTDLWDDLIV